MKLPGIEYIFNLIFPGKYNIVISELGVTDFTQGDGFNGCSPAERRAIRVLFVEGKTGKVAPD